MIEAEAIGLTSVAMPDDGRLALTADSKGNIRLWDLESDIPEPKIFHRLPMTEKVAVTRSGDLAAAIDRQGKICTLDLSTGKIIATWKAHRGMGSDIQFTCDGRTLFSASMSDRAVRKWNPNSGARRGYIKLPFQRQSDTHPCSIAINEHGDIGSCTYSTGIATWENNSSNDIIRENLPHHSAVTMPSDGRFVIAGRASGGIIQRDLPSGDRISSFEGHSGAVTTLQITPDGRYFVSGGADCTVRLWSLESGQCIAILRSHGNVISGLAITPDARRIVSVSLDNSTAIWDIPNQLLQRAAGAERRGYMNAKVVLLGDSGVGKSGLALRLWHDRWKKTDSTHGMEIQRLSLPEVQSLDSTEREVWLWDLAGQPDYRLTHQLFMEQTSLAILVFDPQDGKVFDTLAYWQNALRKVAGERKIVGILVAARCDRPSLRLTLDEMREWASQRGLLGPILTSSKLKAHPGIRELRRLIAESLPWDEMEFRSTMENFPPLKEAIIRLGEEPFSGVVVRPDELEERVRQLAPDLEFSGEELRAVTGLLAGEGVLHALPYGDLVVLQPRWINNYASTIVKLAGEAENQLGHVPLATIQPGKLPKDGTARLSLEDEQQLLPALVVLFLERALAWKQPTDKGEMLVLPSYARLPRQAPPPRPGRTVLYRFTGPLEEIYCTLVVRLHYSGIFDAKGTRLFRQAVDFHTDTGKLAALTMNTEGERGELEIYFGQGLDRDLQASFQRFVHDHLSTKANELERLRNYFCPKCHVEATDRTAIDRLKKEGISKLPCYYCFTTKQGVIDLNDVLEKQFSSNAGEKGADAAERRAAKQISTASMEQVMVGAVKMIVGEADQIYRVEAEPDEGVDGQIEFRDRGGRASGLTYRVQLKSGDSHLRKLKDGTEKFTMRKHYEDLWSREGAVPVILIIRNSNDRMRFINATDAIRAAQATNPGLPVRQINFDGQDFTREAVLQLRHQRLGPQGASLEFSKDLSSEPSIVIDT